MSLENITKKDAIKMYHGYYKLYKEEIDYNKRLDYYKESQKYYNYILRLNNTTKHMLHREN